MRRGDVVIISHPYTDASGAKVRPVLVVQNDLDNARTSNTIVAEVQAVVARRSARSLRETNDAAEAPPRVVSAR